MNDSIAGLRTILARAAISSDGRPMVIYFLLQPERLGQLAYEMFLLKCLFSPVDYQLVVVHPRFRTSARYFAQDAYNICMRDITVLEAGDEADDRAYRLSCPDPVLEVPYGGMNVKLVLGSLKYLLREFLIKYADRDDKS
ncbi:MAG: hypothetical protein JO002_06580, partial [Burkholderiaceae bacterium]|nr:hypothetical protein [Burkholderiaceae bacterium]